MRKRWNKLGKGEGRKGKGMNSFFSSTCFEVSVGCHRKFIPLKKATQKGNHDANLFKCF